ncbi:MAG TPA: hypothetical protein PL182_10325, partial [Pseudobdellovibrionaceae bacterium]|nr:hypothetical protein [Pseudobdellovibrionaceae bacterium]
RLRSSLLLAILPFMARAGGGESALSWRLQEISLSKDVRLEVDEGARHDTLHLPNGEKISLETRLQGGPDAAAFENLTADQKQIIQRTRRDLMLSVSRMALERRLSSLSLVKDDKAVHLAPTDASVAAADLIRLNPLEEAIGIGPDGEIKKDGRFKSFLKMMNEAILLSTYRAARQHWENRRSLKGLTNEFGIQITLKAEFQFGMGPYNITKNLPVVLGLGYRRDTREVMIRVGRRVEKMDGGSAISAGVKVELRKYSRIGSSKGSVNVQGVTWYPPSIPMVSLVGDAAPNYRSMGLVFGLNAADLIPGLYFVNTVNAFTDHEIFVKSVRVPALPSWILRASETLKKMVKPTPVRPPVCGAVFAG